MGSEKKKKSASVKTRVVTADSPVMQSPEKKKAKKETKASAPKKKLAKNKVARKKSDNYFVGAWRELRQVRWPDRATTWSMTFAVIMFTVFFIVIVLLLDAGFKYVFDFAIKK